MWYVSGFLGEFVITLCVTTTIMILISLQDAKVSFYITVSKNDDIYSLEAGHSTIIFYCLYPLGMHLHQFL